MLLDQGADLDGGYKPAIVVFISEGRFLGGEASEKQ